MKSGLFSNTQQIITLCQTSQLKPFLFCPDAPNERRRTRKDLRPTRRRQTSRLGRDGGRRISSRSRSTDATSAALPEDAVGRRHHRGGRRPLEVARLARQQRESGVQRLHSASYSCQVRSVFLKIRSADHFWFVRIFN